MTRTKQVSKSLQSIKAEKAPRKTIHLKTIVARKTTPIPMILKDLVDIDQELWL